MKCSACQIEIEGSFKEHYTSEIHAVNTRRQIYNAPPLTSEEYFFMGNSDDVSIDADGTVNSEAVKIKEKKRLFNTNVPKPIELCNFCGEEVINDHYSNHGLTTREVEMYEKRTCYVCNEVFVNKKDLASHIISGNHRNAIITDKSLTLENGKVFKIKEKCRTGSGRINNSQHTSNANNNNTITVYKKNEILEKTKNVSQKEVLKISLGMNNYYSYKKDQSH